MKLEILQVPDCPNAAVLAARISELAHDRAGLQITRQVVTTEEDADRLGMTGSVTSLDSQLQNAQLPGRVQANPAQHRADDRAPVPLTGRDLIADRVRHTPQPLTHEGRLAVPGPAPKKAHAVKAHADLRVIAKANQRLLRGIATAAPAPALARLTD